MAYIHHKMIPIDGSPPYLTCLLAKYFLKAWDAAVTDPSQATCPNCLRFLREGRAEHPLHALRRQLELTRPQMAKALDIGRRYYQQLEAGHGVCDRVMQRAQRLQTQTVIIGETEK